MLFRISYIVSILLLVVFSSSCKTTTHSRGPKEYVEKNGLNDQRKPHELASELGNQGKKQKRAYHRQLYKSWKKMHPGEPRKANPYR
jgi:hypothetical protein